MEDKTLYVHINLSDVAKMKDKLNLSSLGAPKKTKITISDADTGKEIYTGENKVLITGGQLTACKLWGLHEEVVFPNYNDAMDLENRYDYDQVQPMNEPFICLFAIGRGGCGTNLSDVFPVRYTERIDPKDLLPFRYVDADHDLNADQRKVYFGRKADEDEMIRYYFKAFDSEPQLHLRYLDGTQITENMYGIDSSQAAECYVETRLLVSRQDFRDYFDQVLGWDQANISSVSLLYGWYSDKIDQYRWYQQVIPYTRLNFSNIWLTDLSKAVVFQYAVYY